MTKINLSDLASLTNEQSALNTINANSAVIEARSDTFLSRDGTSPNSMTADLDMNSNQILNIGDPLDMNGNRIIGLDAPVDPTEPLRLADLDALAAVASGIAPGSSGQVIFNDGSAHFGADAGFTYDKTTDSLTVLGTVQTGPLKIRDATLAQRFSFSTGDAGLEIGRIDNVASTAFIDFHTGATSVDFDSRLHGAGGTGVTGGGKLEFAGAAGFVPIANDGAPLGSTTQSWSDLFLASGGVINWADSDVTLTHAANQLSFAGASSGYNYDNTISAFFGGGVASSDRYLQAINGNNYGIWILPKASAGSYSGLVSVNDTAVIFSAGASDSGNLVIAPWSTTNIGLRMSAATSALSWFGTGGFLPGTSDGAALGSATSMWSDLFLASGGVINWNNGDVTITHAANALTIAGADSTTAITASPAAGTDVLRVTNTTDTNNAHLARFGGDRATPANNDSAHISFYLSNLSSTQEEIARIAWQGTDLTAASEDGRLTFFTDVNSTLTSIVMMQGGFFGPTTTDTVALGSSTLMFSDLFLASGGVINFDNGNYTMTHSAGALSLGANTSSSTVSNGHLFIDSGVYFRNDISPAQITADQNNYDPTGNATASVFRLSTDAARNITGIAQGQDGRLLLIHNVGTFDVALVDESASSTAGNRFALSANTTIAGDQSVLLQYDATSSRWRMIGGTGGGAGGGAPTTSQYVTLATDATLTNERVLTAGSGITVTDGGAGGNVTVAISAATQADQETATSTTVPVTPGRQHFHPSAAKAWVKWGVTTTIDASYGVSSITDNAGGDWTVNFTTAFSTANYGYSYSSENSNTDSSMNQVKNGGQAAGSLRVMAIRHSDGAMAEDGIVKNSVAAWGDV